MAAYTSAEYLAQVRRALETPMVQLGVAGFDAPQFTDASIFYMCADAVDDVNLEWETSLVATVTAVSISIAPEPSRDRSRAIVLWTVFLLIDSWGSLNLTDGSIGAMYREGLGTIDTRGQGVLVKSVVMRAYERAVGAVNSLTLGLSTAAGSSTPIITSEIDNA
ncbi:MAG TPA: hypothetical protein VMY37_31855 [Thermoguttaceae bacterium]|nr:hypothetical protein [Thermoguttaceae bacterium]